ncbi:MAG: protein kinase [Rubripirellula sp.]
MTDGGDEKPSIPDPELTEVSSTSTVIDADRLQELIDHARTLQSSGDTSFLQNALKMLDANEREAYVGPLMKWLVDSAVPTSEYQSDFDAPAEPTSITIRSMDTQQADLDDAEASPSEQKNASPAPHLPAPKQIGKFRVKRELGRGAFGSVYLAYDDELDRYVAIKVAHVADPKVQARLRTEAAKLAKVESLGILPVYQIGETDEGRVYLVTKYIQGLTLREVLQRGPLSPARATELTREIAMALDPAHRLDILHRDLKPDNILIEEDGRPWIADFGLAISEDEQRAGRRKLAGTPPYMPPEQIQGRIDFMDPRSDIWALGVMYYEMLCGKLPFMSPDRKALIEQICELDPRPLHQRSPNHLTEQMNDVFLKCCAKKPAERFATVGLLAEELDAMIAGGLSILNIDGEEMDFRATDSLADFGTGDRFRSGRSTDIGRSTRDTQHATAGSVGNTEVSAIRSPLFSALATIGLIVAATIGYLAYDAISSRGDSVEQADAKIMGLAQADGSEQKPWVVASAGPASHRTISAAVASAKPGDLIRVIGGTYNESVRIDKSVTIEGKPPTANVYECEIKNRDNSPLIVDCLADQKVIIRNLKITGLGHRVDENEFNAVEFVGGVLRLENCELQTNSFNCIKARAGTSLEIDQCDFAESRKFAVSTKDHLSLLARECTFRGAGIQFVGGDGQVQQCGFFGSAGIYAGKTPSGVLIEGCEFESATEYAVCCSNDGIVDLQENSMVRCEIGVWIVATDVNANAGTAKLGSGTFEDCTVSISVQGGTLTSSESALRRKGACSIDGGTVGVGIAPASSPQGLIHPAKVVLGGLQIDGADWGIRVTGDAIVKLAECELIQCVKAGIQLEAGKLLIEGGSIQGCNQGLIVGNKSQWPELAASAHVRSAEISDTESVGVTVYSGPVMLENVVLGGGAIGMAVEGPANLKPDESASVEVRLLRCNFVDQSSIGVFAKGAATVKLDVGTGERLQTGTGTRKTSPAEIVVVSDQDEP